MYHSATKFRREKSCTKIHFILAQFASLDPHNFRSDEMGVIRFPRITSNEGGMVYEVRTINIRKI